MNVVLMRTPASREDGIDASEGHAGRHRIDTRLPARAGSQLHNHTGALIDCEAWVENGGVHVLVKPADEPPRTQTFAECGEAVRWAVDLERTLVAEGWIKAI